MLKCAALLLAAWPALAFVGTSTAVSLTASANPASFGAPETLTATVTPPTATGKVTFYDAGLELGGGPLSGGQATFRTPLLSAGPHTLTARYDGDANNSSSLSAALAITVKTQPSQTFRWINGAGSSYPLIADFNGDGKPDLVIAGPAGPQAPYQVVFGNGDGTFTPGPSFPDAGSALIGDFNGDGLPDVAEYVDGGIQIFLNVGGNSFVQAAGYTGPIESEFFFLADFNNDGNLDVLFGEPNGLTLLSGNGDGSFSPPSIVSSSPVPLFAADFNRDGNVDVIDVKTDANGNVQAFVLLGNGDGTFQTGAVIPDSFSPSFGIFSNITVADFNGDGKPDILAFGGPANDAGADVVLYLGNGDGTFQNPFDIPLVNPYPFPNPLFSIASQVLVSDFNGDGNLDVAVTFPSNPPVLEILPGNGNGTFGAPTMYTGLSSGFAVADFNGDNYPDILLNSGQILLGELSSQLTLTSSAASVSAGAPVTFTAALAPTAATGAISFYSNGKLLASQPVSAGTAALTVTGLNSGSQTITAAYTGDSSTAAATSNSVTLQVNGTPSTLALSANPTSSSIGTPVVFTATVIPAVTGGVVTFYDFSTLAGSVPLSGSTAAFTTTQLTPGPHSVTATFSGNPSTNPSSSNAVALTVTTQPTSAFLPGNTVDTYDASTLTPEAVASADVNGDGAADIVAALSNEIVLLIGNGDGATQPAQTLFTAPAAITALIIADINADGKPDILFNQGTSVIILLGNGNGTFQSPISTTVSDDSVLSQEISQIQTGDFNGDGLPDLALAAPDGTFILLGAGDGTFRQSTIIRSYVSVVAADFNADGLTDLALGGDQLAIFLSNGDGTFRAGPVYLAGLGSITPKLTADFNLDGKIDIAANEPGPAIGFPIVNVVVLLGIGDGTFNVVPQTTEGAVPVSVGDFNNDGIPDIFANALYADGFSGNGQFLFGNGDGTFTQPIGNFEDPLLLVGDFFNNGRVSLIGIGGGTVSISPGTQASTLALTLNSSSLNYGQPLTLTATVTPSTATGTVTFYAENSATTQSVTLGTEPVSAGAAALTVSTLAAGSYSLSASYSGDLTDLPSESSPIPLVIVAAPTSTQFTVAGTSFTIAQPLTLTATVTPSALIGVVAFYDGATQIATASVQNGAATAVVSLSAAGAHSLQAFYTGDAGDLSSASAPIVVSVTEIASTGFSGPVLLGTPGPTLSVTTADFNHDGITDIAAQDANGITVLLGTGDGAFRAGSYISLSSNLSPNTLLAGDINLDGNTDLILNNQVLFGNGDGAFQTPSPIQIVPGQVPPLLLIDVNDDGRLDSISPNVFLNSCFFFCPPPQHYGVVVYPGDLNATFDSHLDSGYGSYYQLFSGDFNNDGKVDLVGSGGGAVGILLANGGGTFNETLTPSGVTILGVGDFNNDGKLDVLGSLNLQIAILLGNGDGTFSAPITSAADFTGNVSVADINGDGKLDLIAVNPNSPGPISVYFGNGDGTFQAAQQFATTASFNPGAYAVADFNRDGKADLVVVDSVRSDVQILLGSAATTLSLSAASNPVAAGATLTVTATVSPITAPGLVTFLNGATVLGTASLVNGVAALSTVFPDTGDYFLTATYSGTSSNAPAASASLTVQVTGANPTSTTLTVTPNPASLGQPVTLSATVSGASSGIVTFYDGAQVIGIVPVANGTAAFNTSLLAAGSHALKAMFDSGVNLEPGSSPAVSLVVSELPASTGFLENLLFVAVSPAAMVAADLNQDGKPDLVVVDTAGHTQVLLGVGNSDFNQTSPVSSAVTAPNSSVSLVSGDFNGDGIPDVAFTSASDAKVVVLLGSPGGQLQPPASFTTGSVQPVSVVAADLNGDGKLDLAAAGEGGIAILFGNGDGTFTPPQFVATLATPVALAIADFNGDAIPDVASLSASGVEVHLGDGAGSFAAAVLIPVAGAQPYFAAGDVNGDGKPDLVVETSAFAVLLGNGDGAFQAPLTTSPPIGDPGPMLLADLNGDGYLDIAEASGAEVAIDYGNGDGSFTAQLVEPAVNPISAIAAGDFHSDGRTALALGSTTSPSVQVLIQAPVFFSDVPIDPVFFPAVTLLEEAGITAGCGASDFCPDQNITRAEAAVLLVRGILGTGNFTYSTTPNFTDVPANAFGFAYIQKLVELGLTTGCGGGNFCPNATVTRAEAAVFIILARYGAANAFPYSPAPLFADVPAGAFGFPYIQRLFEDSITYGCSSYPVTDFCPNSPVTREEMAVFIERGLFNFGSGLGAITSVTPNVVSPGESGIFTFFTAGVTTPFTLNNVAGINFGAPVESAANPYQWTVSFTVDPNAAALPEPLWITIPDSANQVISPNAITIQ